VLDAVRELFLEGGYPATTIEAVAERSGVAKTTIYRWWPNRPALVVDLLLQVAGEVAPPPTGGDPLRALRTELHMVAEAADALPGRLLSALLGESQNDPQIRDTLIRGLFDPRRNATAKVIRQLQDRGELRKDIPALVALDLFFGPVFYRRFIRQESATPEFVRQIYQAALAGMEAGPRAPARARPAGRGRKAHRRSRPT